MIKKGGIKSNIFTYTHFIKKRLGKIFFSGFFAAAFISLCLVIFHRYDSNQQHLEKIENQKKVLQETIESANKQLNFLIKRLDKESISDFPNIAKKLPRLSYDIIRDAMLIEGTLKYSRLGQTDALKSDVQYVFDGIREDGFGNLVFARMIQNGSVVIRISKRALLEILGSDSLHVTNIKEEYSFPVDDGLWLTFESKKEPFWESFFHRYWIIIISIFLFCYLLSIILTICILNTFYVTRSKFKNYIYELKDKENKFFEQNKILKLENSEYFELAAALKIRHKIQNKWFAELQSRKNDQICKIVEISELTSRSLASSENILNEFEMVRLLTEISKSADNLLGDIIVCDNSDGVSLQEVMKEVNQFLEWNLLKSKASLEISIEENGLYLCDVFALKILLLNVIVFKLSKAFEGAVISICIKNIDGSLEVECGCFEALEIGGKKTSDLNCTPLILSEYNMEKLAKKIHLDFSGLGSKVTVLKTIFHEKTEEIRGENVIQMFH